MWYIKLGVTAENSIFHLFNQMFVVRVLRAHNIWIALASFSLEFEIRPLRPFQDISYNSPLKKKKKKAQHENLLR